jgi:hypothetical protein
VKIIITILITLCFLVIFVGTANAGEEGKVYGKDYNLKYRIEGNKIYSPDYRLKYHIEGNKIYDENYN